MAKRGIKGKRIAVWRPKVRMIAHKLNSDGKPREKGWGVKLKVKVESEKT